jgi:hypothetical protein
MKDPLPQFILQSENRDSKRRMVEDRIEQDIQFVPMFHKKENYPLWPPVYAALDMIATVYSKYRFGEIDKAALEARYEQISLDKQILETLNHTKEGLIREAEAAVDQAINEVCFGEKRTQFAGENAYSRKEPFPKSTLGDFQPHVMSKLLRDTKESVQKEMDGHYQRRADKGELEARAMFAMIQDYTMRYIDYRLNRAPDGYDSEQDYIHTLGKFEALGMGEHVSAQFIRRAEKIADDTLADRMGGRKK